MFRARDRRRILLSALAAVGAAIACDSPSGIVEHTASLAIRPQLTVAYGSFGGLTIDKVELIAVRGAESVTQTYPFSPDSTEITTAMSLPVTDTATYTVTVDLLASGTLMFTGQAPILVTAGQTAAPVRVPLHYVGPGMNIDSVRIAPRDSVVAPGGQLPFRVAAYDSSGAPVAQFYVHWATSSESNTINAAGLFRAGATTGTVWVYASTPTGVFDSTQLTVGTGSPGVPAKVTKVAGDAQSAAVGTAVAVAPKVMVTDAFNTPLRGVASRSRWRAAAGAVTGGSATTNASGLACVGSWTLGRNGGARTR